MIRAEQQLDRARRELVGIRVRRARDLGRELGHVVALVAALGHLLAARARPHRLAEQPDLVAGVVEVVLARDRVAVVLEDPRQRVAVGGVAPAGRDQRPGRVGGDELDQDPLGRVRAARAERDRPASSTDRSAPRCQTSDSTRFRKPGTGDLGALEPRRPGSRRARRRARSAITRGGAPSTGASSIAALVA